MLIVLALSWGFALRTAVAHKRLVLRAPWLDDVTRHRLQSGDAFERGRAIEALPPGTRVGGVSPMARYYIDPRRWPDITWDGGR
jgi:hypothetical protein